MDWHEDGGLLYIEMRVPTSFLAQFSSGGDVLMQFLGALQARGVDVGATESLRTSIRYGVSVVSWSGQARGNVSEVLPTMIKEITGQ
jgi:hypothetical protein